jgi:hypothetical protein
MAKAAGRAKPQAADTSMAAQPGRPASGTVVALERLANLRIQGALSNEEFLAAKARVLGTRQSSTEAGRAPATLPSVEANVTAARHLANLAGQDRSESFASVGND